MEIKQIIVSMLSIAALITGMVDISAGAASYSFNFSLVNGQSGYSSFYKISSSSEYASIQANQDVIAVCCNNSYNPVTETVFVCNPDEVYHMAYTTAKVNLEVCLKLTNVQGVKVVSGRFDPNGSF